MRQHVAEFELNVTFFELFGRKFFFSVFCPSKLACISECSGACLSDSTQQSMIGVLSAVAADKPCDMGEIW